MSLLTLCQDAARELRLAPPATIIGNTDDTAQLLLRLAQVDARALMRAHPWQALIREHSFTTTAADVQTGGVPADFDRLLPDSVFNRSTRRRVAGPLSPEEWSHAKASLITYVNPTFRLRGGDFLMTPTPPAGETIAYEYVSRYIARASGGALKETFTVDTDTAVLDESLITMGVIWRFRQSAGLPYGDEMAEQARQVLDALMRDGAKPRISSDPVMSDRVATRMQVPETWVI
jgi:hypothetical protein